MLVGKRGYLQISKVRKRFWPVSLPVNETKAKPNMFPIFTLAFINRR